MTLNATFEKKINAERSFKLAIMARNAKPPKYGDFQPKFWA